MTFEQDMFDHWNGRAHSFDAGASHRRDSASWTKVFESALGRGPGRALDLGCGTGACALILARLGFEVTAVDGSRGMLSVAQAAAADEVLDIRFVESDILAFPPQAEPFDVVTIRNVLWTLSDPVAVLEHARKLLAPNGRLLVADGVWRQTPDPRLKHLEPQMPYGSGIQEEEARQLLAGGWEDVRSWQRLFTGNPYGRKYDTDDAIDFFVLTATPKR